MAIRWEAEGVNGKGYWITPEGDKLIVAVDPRYLRSTEVETLLGDTLRLSWAGHPRPPSMNWCPKWFVKTQVSRA